MDRHEKTAEQFLREYFDARVSEERRIQADLVHFRRRFFTADCAWASRAGTIEMMESEKIVSVEVAEAETRIVTIYEFPNPSGLRSRQRYHLKPELGRWLIQHVEIGCPACNGRGDMSCPYCKGKHWL